MFNPIKKIIERVKKLNSSVNEYKKDTIIQSLPSLTYVNRAKKLIDKGMLEQAESILREALELPQQDALVYKYLGLVCEKQNKFDLAEEYFVQSAKLNPQDKIIWQKLGFTYISLKKYEQAQKAFENANKIQAGNTDNYTGWGMSLLRQNKFTEAHEKLETATKLDKYNLWALFLCAVTEIKLQMYDEADAKLSFLTKVSPNVANFVEYAHLKLLKKDYENASYHAGKAVSLNPEFLPAYTLLGEIYTNMYDRENSLKQFEIANEKGLKTFDFYFHYGRALNRFEKYSRAKEMLLKAYEINPEPVYADLAVCLAMLDEDASQYINSAPEKTSLAQGIIQYKSGDYEKAVKLLKSCEETALSNYFLAKCYEKLGNISKAGEYYEASVTKYSGMAVIDYINYLISRENYDTARLKLRKALKNNKDDVKLLNLMFFVNYKLAKDNVCEYNIKEALASAEKIENPDLFEYPELKQELTELMRFQN